MRLRRLCCCRPCQKVAQNTRLPFQTKTPMQASFPIGKYRLDASIDGLAGLVEFSATEYATIGRQFEGEKNYNAPEVTFLGRPWKLMLGTVQGRIYKIAPYLELRTKQEANPVAMATLQYCIEQLGKPSSQETGLFIWDTTDGNVILADGRRLLSTCFLHRGRRETSSGTGSYNRPTRWSASREPACAFGNDMAFASITQIYGGAECH